MAIKFSQFVVKTSSSDLSHIVGYNGVDNIQITPTNFLNSALTGTAGQVLFYDTTGVTGDNDLYWDNSNKRLGVGTASPAIKLDVVGDAQLQSVSPRFAMKETSANKDFSLKIQTDGRFSILNDNLSSEVFTITQGGNVGIGTTSPGSKLQVDGNIKVGVSQKFIAGNGNDLTIQHNGTVSAINNAVGNIQIYQNANDGDIQFYSDDGSGGVTEYFRVDGGDVRTIVSKPFRFIDSIAVEFGTGLDMQLYHSGGEGTFFNYTGNLRFIQGQDDGDITFSSDDGSGGVTEYFRVDGSSALTIFSKNLRMIDTAQIQLGGGSDLRLRHNATDSYIENYNGDFYIDQNAADKDIVFRSDDGSGGVTSYFELDGSDVVTKFRKNLYLLDNVGLKIGNSFDLDIKHDGSDSYIQNATGHLYIQNSADDSDIKFFCDDGSGGTTAYFFLDGSRADGTYLYTEFPDNSVIGLGDDTDLQIYHTGTYSVMDNFLGDLIIQQRADDKDIIFKCDDGSGGVATYFSVDGGGTDINFFKDTHHIDNVKAKFGSNSTGDLNIYHNGTASFINNETGDLNIANYADDKDIRFYGDDGAGSVTEYFRLDGSTERIESSKSFRFADGQRVQFGASSDMQIYHDGNNSYIDDSGTGDLRVRSNFMTIEKYNNGEIMASFNDDNAVSLYFNNSKKFETTGTGVKISGVSEYADNTAAIAGGLTTGDVYRTGDLLKIVH